MVEETGVPRENHPPVASNSQTLSHNVVSSTLSLSGHVILFLPITFNVTRGCHGRDCMVVVFTTNVVSSNPAHGEVYLTQHIVLKFVSDL